VPASPSRAPATPPRPATDWIGLGDASALLGVSAGTLRRWSDAGRIPVFTTPGGHRRFSRRALGGLVPRRRERALFGRLAASSERIARAYGIPSRRRRLPREDASWVARLPEDERIEFRLRGRMLVEDLLKHLDESSGGTSPHLERAVGAASAHGRAMAELGCSTVEAVETFLRFRAPFVDEMTRIARRQGQDAHEATELLSRVESALDRLLVATIDGHARAHAGPAPRAAVPAGGDGGGTRRRTRRVPL
jgi:excisionase family DNA binding protein